MTLRLVIWDLDGTLVDSRRMITGAMDAAFAAVGLPEPGYDGMRHIVGLSLDEAMRRLAPEGAGPDLIARMESAYKEEFVAQRARPDHHEPLYDGARQTLERLAGAGWLMAVATGKGRRGVEVVFDHHDLGAFFDAVRCADDGPGKPHPFMVEDALTALGVAGADAVMVGDTAHDMAMARAAGVRAIGVTWGFHTPDEVAAGGADEVHHDFSALNAALDAFASGGERE
ncbi:MAG: HAD-IA family hydrolase [Caulobacterales bacterium]|nr:HAD-IA family hydrolase [Caulobacterales bacterium]